MREPPGTAFQPPTVCFRRNVVSPVAAVELRSTGSRAVTQLASSPCAINNAPRHPPGIGRGQFCFSPRCRVQISEFRDRKSTRLNSSHQIISYAVFCLKKKKRKNKIV